MIKNNGIYKHGLIKQTLNGSLCLGYRVLRLAFIASVLLMAMGPLSVLAQDNTTAAPDSLHIYVDTKTFSLNLSPGYGRAPLELSIDILRNLNTSSEGLTPVTLANGVTMIDFKGRFHPVWFAVTDSEGKVHPFCITSLPAPVQLAAQAVLNSQGVQ